MKKAPIWKAVAEELNRNRSRRRIVNIGEIARTTKKGNTIIVPGKVLGTGILEHAVTVGAASFSSEAANKISNAGGKPLLIKDFIKTSGDEKGVLLIG